MTKRILSIILSVVLIASCCYAGFHAYAENKTIDINKELLESLLNDRYWVIETLVEDDLSKNPYAEAGSLQGTTLSDEVLENYQENEVFKFVVNALDIYSEPGDYISDITDGLLTGLMNLFACDTSEGVFGALDDLIASKDELRYESVLNAVLQSDYTSSWGQTLFEQNMELEHLKQLGSLLGKLSAYQTVLKDTVGLHGTTDATIVAFDPLNKISADYEIDIDTYANHFLNAYEQDLEAALMNTIAIPGVQDDSALEKKILAASYMGVVFAYERVVLPEIEMDLDEVFYDGLFKDSMAIINGAGKVMDIANKTIDYAILMESLQSQKNGMVATMDRIEAVTMDEDLIKVLNNYADLVNTEGDELTLNYEIVANYLRNSQTITNFVTKKVTDGVPKLLEAGVTKYGGASEIVLHNSIAKSLARFGKLLEIVVWVADETTGIQETAKKIHVLKYVDRLIDEAVKTFNHDLAVYNYQKTDEHARAVIDDLEFLKALRLYGEKVAYGSVSGQADSLLAILLGNDFATEELSRRHQSCIDTYLGCTISPVSNNKLVLSKGDILKINTLPFQYSEGVYSYAIWEKASGETLTIAEPEYRLFNGVELNGATVKIYNTKNGLYLPVVENDSNGASIEIYCDNVAIGNINNSGELTISQEKTGVTYEVIERIDNSGTLTLSGYENSADISVYGIQNTGTMNIEDMQINLVSNAENNGTITGLVNVCGGAAFYENSYFTMGRQTLLGSGTYSDLKFTSTAKNGVKAHGDLSVTNSISNSSTRLVTSENIKLTDSCTIKNNYFKGSLGFRDYTGNQSFTIDGMAGIHKSVSFGGAVTINDSLNLTSSCTSLKLNGNTLVKGDLLYEAGAISGNGELSVKGDVNITTASPSISYLKFVGSTAQRFDSSNALTVSKLNNTNTSLGGVTFNQKIYVTDTLYSGRNSAYGNGKNVVLTQKAKLDGNTIKGNISAENWECTDSVNIKGNFYTTGNVSVAENTVVNTINFYQSSGALTLNENSALNCSGEYSNKGTVTNNGTVSVTNDSVISGAFKGGTLKTKGDVAASAELTPETLIFEGKTSQNFKNTSSTTVQNLTVSNTSKSGLTVDSIIYVNNCFNDSSVKINNGEKIILNSGAIYLNNGATQTDLSIESDFTVKSGEVVTVNGDLILKSGANLIVEDGGEIYIKNSLKATSSQINVASGGVVQVNDYFNSSSATLNISGDFIVTGDCKITSSTVNADGLITFNGDLDSSSCTWNNPNVCFAGKLKQTVSGSAINVNNLTVNNSSKSGITFNSTVNYYGAYDKGNSVINGETYIVEK